MGVAGAAADAPRAGIAAVRPSSVDGGGRLDVPTDTDLGQERNTSSQATARMSACVCSRPALRRFEF